jgi:hypothetical protein
VKRGNENRATIQRIRHVLTSPCQRKSVPRLVNQYCMTERLAASGDYMGSN